MRSYTTSSQSNEPRRDNSRHNEHNKSRYNRDSSNNNSNNQRNFESRRDPDRREQPQRQHQYQPRERLPSQGDRDRSTNRVQYPDSSISRDPGMNLGSVKFTPGYPTRELPPIETKPDPTKKFTGRCRLFVGNLPHNTTEDKVRALFEPFGEIGELFLGPKSSFAFVKMNTKQNAEAARDALDCSNFDGRSLRVRLAAHAAAIKVKHLSPVVTNELLAYAFRYFGEIERAVVIVDDKGKSTGEGIVEYSRKQSALYAIKRCQQECFMLTQAPIPVLVEPFDQQDEDEGLPEKSINKNTEMYKEQRDVGPRFAEQGSFEHSFALRWKELYQLEKQKRDNLEQEILEARQNLQNTIEISRLEHKALSLKSQLQQLEDNRMKLQQMKEQNLGGTHEREEQRRKQEMAMRQREEDVLRHQQSSGSSNFLNQSHSMRGVISPEGATTDQNDQQTYSGNNFMRQDADQSNLSVNPMLGNQSLSIQGQLNSFNAAAMVSMGYMHQTPMGGYIPPPPLQVGAHDDQGSGTINYQQESYSSYPTSSGISEPRNQKFNNSNQGNNINITTNNGRGRKRARF